MNRHAIQLISRGAINKIGNMLYDYGNSVWLASMGTIGQTVLGIYQISELVTSILVNPFGGVISDRWEISRAFWRSVNGFSPWGASRRFARC